MFNKDTNRFVSVQPKKALTRVPSLTSNPYAVVLGPETLETETKNQTSRSGYKRKISLLKLDPI